MSPHAAVAVEVHFVEDLADGAAGLELPRRRLHRLRHLDDERAEVVGGARVDGEEHAAASFVGEGVRRAAHTAEGIGLAVRPAGDAGKHGRGHSQVVRAAPGPAARCGPGIAFTSWIENR